MSANAERAVARCRELALISDAAGATTRTFLSPAMMRCNDLVAAWMREAGMEVAMDAAGNLRGSRPSASSGRVLIGSHLDTVPNAGAFDGPLGVMLGIEIAEALRDVELPFAIEVLGFSEEEGVRFAAPFIGSRALVGALDDQMLERRDAEGISIREALAKLAQERNDLMPARLTANDVLAYFEFHIEQGPVLEAEKEAIGVVRAIAGQSRLRVSFTGKTNHAGTTPMELRQDALAAAAEWIGRVESAGRETPGLVVTVGSLEVWPGASNVIPGSVRASLDVRSAEDEIRLEAVRALLDAADSVASSRRVSVAVEELMNTPAVAMDAGLIALLEQASDGARTMVSGAGHDAMVMASEMPAVMLFVRSPGGLSHHPEEDVRQQDVALALEAGIRWVHLLAERELHAQSR